MSDDLLPHLIDVGPLAPYEANARTHSDEQLELIKASIRRFGFIGTLAYEAPDRLKIGHGRREAALAMWAEGEDVWGPGKRAKFPPGQLPAVDVTGLTDDEIRALVIADNQIATQAGWDRSILEAELAALAAADFDMPLLGFGDDELAALMDSAGSGGGSGKTGWGAMADEFLIPPFTILNARAGWWQDRKRAWLALGIKSELGRGEDGRTFGQDLMRGEGTNVVSGSEPPKRKGRKPHPAPGEGGGAYGNNGGRDDPKWGGKKPDAIPGGAGANSVVRTMGFPDKAAGLGGTAFDALSSHPRYYEQKTLAEQRVGRTLSAEEFERDHWRLPDSEIASGTSIFDPVLTELIYRWFSPVGGKILDPFAGGSVRGIVAAALGRPYVGIDLRAEQVAANAAQWPIVQPQLLGDYLPVPFWHVGDSRDLLSAANEVDEIGEDFDLIFTCPPYGDLETYSDDPADISTLTMAEFDIALASIVQRSVARLKPDRFAAIVVGDYRDKHGLYCNLVGKTVAAFESAGAGLYNEAILVTSVGSLAIRAAKQFRATRKMGKSHQNVLCFVKGDAKKATAACGHVDVSAAMADVEPDDED